MKRPPDEVLWAVATVSLVLPFIGGGLGFIGLVKMLRGDPAGGWWLATGVAILVVDILSDIWLHRVGRSHAAEPSLNARGHHLCGRVAVLEQAIAGGRGRIRIGDSAWSVTGPDLPVGTTVRVTGCQGVVLTVEPVGPG